MKRYKGVIFDMNGTMIDDMRYHEAAWYDILVNQLKAPLSREQLKHQLYGKQHEMFHRIFGLSRFSMAEISEISERKEKKYRDEYRAELKLIAGLDEFLHRLKAIQIALSIGTAAPIENIDFVLDSLRIRDYFKAIVGPHDVKNSKPDPEVFLKAAQLMGIDPSDCLVFEDVPHGIEAARRSGMDSVGVTSFHTEDELRSDNVIAIVKDYNDPQLNRIFDL